MLPVAMCKGVRHGSLQTVGHTMRKNSTFVQSYAEGDQEGLSQLMNSLTLGEDWGVGANPEIENFIVNNGYASPLKFTRFKGLAGYGHSIFQAGRAYGAGSLARDPSYEGFWNTEEFSDKGQCCRLLASGIPT